MSSTYLFQNNGSQGGFDNASDSKCCIVNSDSTTDTGEPIGHPLICLNNLPLHWKVQDSRHNLVSLMISLVCSRVCSLNSSNAFSASSQEFKAKLGVYT